LLFLATNAASATIAARRVLTERERDREGERQRGRETERERDREGERQRGRETERERDREKEIKSKSTLQGMLFEPLCFTNQIIKPSILNDQSH
jgi:hypothetical protein